MSPSYVYTSYVWPSIIASLIIIVLGVYSARSFRVPAALPFALACLFTLFWLFGSIMEYMAQPAALKIFWHKFQILWQLLAPIAITCFILDYAWPKRWLTRRNLILLSIIPLLLLATILTNDLHRLFWKELISNGVVIATRGPLNNAFLAFAYFLGAVNLIVLVWLFIQSPHNRWPVVIMLMGQIVARGFYLLEVVDQIRFHLPYSSIGLAFLSSMYAIVLFGFRILGSIPLAMQMLVTKMQDGILVVDNENKITKINPAAQNMLGISKKGGLGMHVEDLLKSNMEKIALLLEEGEGQIEIQWETHSESYFYLLDVSTIKDWREAELGHVLLVRDISKQKQAQAKILEQQKALAIMQERWRLARDLHDNLAQVLAFVNVQGQSVHHLLSQGDIKTADTNLVRLIEVAREADVDIRESIMSLRVPLTEHEFFPTLMQYLSQYEKSYAIHTELIKPPSLEECCLDPLVETQLLSILQEALTNVRKHANANNIEIKFESEAAWMNVTVKDDGQGFNPYSSKETMEEHIGLRVMRERAEEIGGTLSLLTELGQGTQIMVRVPMGSAREND